MNPFLYHRLKQHILQNSGSLGATLSERVLAHRLRVSRSPIREVLKALEQEGFVRIFPRRGTFVASLTLHDIREIFQLREALDTFAVRYAASHPPPGLEILHRRFQRLAQKGERATFEEMRDAWKLLFDQILHSLNNRRFWKVYSDLFEQVEMVRRFSTSTPRRIAEAVRLGRDITQALLKGEPSRAEHLLRLHRKKSRQVIAEAFIRLEQEPAGAQKRDKRGAGKETHHG